MTRLISLDLFAGAGGASWGHYLATGQHPDVAVNHNAVAVEIHALNHPTTEHWVQNIYQVSPMPWLAGAKSAACGPVLIALIIPTPGAALFAGPELMSRCPQSQPEATGMGWSFPGLTTSRTPRTPTPTLPQTRHCAR